MPPRPIALAAAAALLAGAAHAYAPQDAGPEATAFPPAGIAFGPKRTGKSDRPALVPVRTIDPTAPAPTPEPEDPARTIDPLDPEAPFDALIDEAPPLDDPHAVPSDAATGAEPRATLQAVRRDPAELPPAVATARTKLMEAARTGDIEALRPLFEAQRGLPIVAGLEAVKDPIAHLANQSGDGEGREILAILLELLETGWVRVGEGAGETYIWPYFAEVSLDSLEAPQLVELYRILTALDVEELQRVGRYTFYRVGIAPDGRIRYFSAGDLE